MIPFKILLRNKKNNKGLYPIILRINKNRRSKMITLGMSCKKEDWDSENEIIKKSDKKHLQKNGKLIKLKEKAEEIVRQYDIDEVDFSLEEFENKFRRTEPQRITVLDFFEKIINELLDAGKIGAAQPLINTKNSLFHFANKKLKFRDITPDFLRNYEAYLRADGNRDGGIAFKMREIRRLFNRAITDDIASFEAYPFRKYKISKLKGASRKIALSLEEMKRFKEVDLSNHPTLQNSHRYFLFSYYTRGMNFTDMMKLKWTDIKDQRIYYMRSKTKKNLNIKIIPPVQKILKHFEQEKRNTDYVFPILLSNDMTPQQVFNRKHKVLRKHNLELREIADLADINSRITTYTARHSYATHMKQKGASIEVISESMGHSSVLVTMNYLKDFENDYLDDENDRLLEEPLADYEKAS